MSDKQIKAGDVSVDENDLIKARYDHLAGLKQAGVDPYPATAQRTHTTAEALTLWEQHKKQWGKTPGSPVQTATDLTVVGRITALRSHGGATFADVEDDKGKLQLLAQESVLKTQYNLWSLFDLGDFVEVSGPLFITKRGEVTLHVDSSTFLAKSLRPLPDKWAGLEDKEKRFRERYADLIANPEVRQKFYTRTRLVKSLRDTLENAQFMEVETPILQTIAGGATAKPFITHYNAYDADVFLRVAPELYHKRLIVGGFERVYEFARVFRNEGVDHSHSPEFTDLEFYAAYWNYEQMMDFSETMIRNAVKESTGELTVAYKEMKIDFKPKFKRIAFADAIKAATGIKLAEETEDSLREKIHQLKIDVPAEADFGKLADYLYKAKVRPTIIQPTFLIDHPIELSPLAKKKTDREVQRFQLVVASEFELCNAFSELNDPVDQRERFLKQQELRKRGDEEAQPFDEDYIRALEYGMPPTAGFGMGIDRFAALVTNSHTLREVILFPYMRPKDHETHTMKHETPDQPQKE